MAEKRKRIYVNLGRYDPQVHRGINAYAKKANWCLNRFMHARPDPPVGQLYAGGLIIEFPWIPVLPACEAIGLPVVQMLPEEKTNGPSVSVDHKATGEAAARYLLGKGHTRLASLELYGSLHHREAIRAFCLGLKERQPGYLALRKPEGLSIHGATEQRLRKWLVTEIKKLTPGIAVFCPGDREGSFALEALIDGGLKCPEDVALVSSENSEEICEFTAVPMTSVDTNLFQVGYRAAEKLDAMLQNRRVKRHTCVEPVGIVERVSSSRFAAADRHVGKAMSYIGSHLADGISIQSIARYVGISHTVLYEKFYHHLGFSPGEAIAQLRIERIQKLLRQGSIKCSAIARQVGYANEASLARAFKHQTGETISNYRNRLMGAD